MKKKRIGRPPKSLSEKQKRKAIKMAMDGEPIQAIVAALNISIHKFWTIRQRDALFREKFAVARDEGLESLADGLITVADDYLDPQRARVKSESVRWLLSKRKASVYGDRVDLNVSSNVNLLAALADARSRLPACDQDPPIELQPLDSAGETFGLPTGSRPVPPLALAAGPETRSGPPQKPRRIRAERPVERRSAVDAARSIRGPVPTPLRANKRKKRLHLYSKTDTNLDVESVQEEYTDEIDIFA